MSYTPNSFVGLLYTGSFLAGAMYGSMRIKGLKEKHRDLLVHDIEKAVNQTKTKSFEEGIVFQKAASAPKIETGGFTDELDQLVADVVGAELVRDILA
ncbi:hypothetical protein PPL_12004 [Heterostelium album PN500]|uniref:ATP synthase subunit e, mitochondrial n=1 Tax=Heterostelium pallidum (strain ATCC 26659 / Pp 5 / PN500) TaxID=670386 RepID=D3BV32_HETP5|nr:hypothetical protein PPL_12004 [Heterostelium album PN500]EFA74970.1 hypothetical protein PPL_12004 [Heterostelium album PN500]|eukprot:XP_020427104.1 hypothetical protein PPL_12004 [Heterostelium album PN500]